MQNMEVITESISMACYHRKTDSTWLQNSLDVVHIFLPPSKSYKATYITCNVASSIQQMAKSMSTCFSPKKKKKKKKVYSVLIHGV